MKSGLQKQNSKSDSNSVSIQMELKDIADAFCILPEDINKKKVDFSLELMNQVIRAGYTNEDPQKISDNTLIGIGGIKPKDTIEAMLAAQMLQALKKNQNIKFGLKISKSLDS